jgi:hypothetical protein
MSEEQDTILVRCPNSECQRQWRISATLQGRLIRCPDKSCQTIIQVPERLEEADDAEDEIPRRSKERPRRDEEDEPRYTILDEEDEELPRRRSGITTERSRYHEEEEAEEDFEEAPRRRQPRRTRPPRRREYQGPTPESQDACSRSSKILFIVAGLTFVCVGGQVLALSNMDNPQIPKSAIEAAKLEWILGTGLYLVLGFVALFRPFLPILIGLAFYVYGTVLVLSLFGGDIPRSMVFSLIMGLMIRVAITISMINALLACIHAWRT